MPLHWLPFLSQHHESTTTFRKERLPDDSCKEIKTWMCTYYLVALTFETHMDGNSALQVFAQSINWSFDLYLASVEKETQLLIVGKKARRKRASWQTVLHSHGGRHYPCGACVDSDTLVQTDSCDDMEGVPEYYTVQLTGETRGGKQLRMNKVLIRYKTFEKSSTSCRKVKNLPIKIPTLYQMS